MKRFGLHFPRHVSNLLRQLIKTFFSRTQNQQGQNAACNEPHGDMNGFLRNGISDA